MTNVVYTVRPMTNVEKLQQLWKAVVRQPSFEAIHNLIEHAQNMEADRVATLLDEMLEQPERLAGIDGDIIVRQLRAALLARSYRAEGI